jgi:hypothetical protein
MGSLHRMAVLCGLTVLLASTAQAEEWKTAKEEEGIKVSLSEVAGSQYKAYRGVTVMKTTMAKLRALQEDVPGACTWIHECKTQKLLKHEGSQSTFRRKKVLYGSPRSKVSGNSCLKAIKSK